jgi:AcrR family transcriptional regulator
MQLRKTSSNLTGQGIAGHRCQPNWSRRKRTISKDRARTKVNIIETAERLFGLHGIDGVSLRQISIEAGAANNCAITYHFENLEGLLHAIFMHRLPQAEARRREMLAAVQGRGREPSVRDLIVILYAPLTEQVDNCGRCSFAAFLAGLLRFDHHPGRRKVAELTPTTADVAKLLSHQLPQLSKDQFRRRFAIVEEMVLSGITQLGNSVHGVPFDQLLDMAEASLKAGGRRTAHSRLPATIIM